MKNILFILLALFLYFITILVAGRFNMWIHVFLLVSFFMMNYRNRLWLKNHQGTEIGKIRISKIEKAILFPGMPNSFYKGNVRFQRLLVFNTIVSFVLMSTVFSTGIMVLFQLVTVVIHFIFHFFLGVLWTLR